MKILLIDDDFNLSKVLTYQLQKNGYDVRSANSGTSGLDIFKKEKFDIVITDIQMPDVSGIEVLQEIRRFDKIVIIIIITAHGSADNAIEACKLGANDYITKPFGQEQLLFTIQKAVQLKGLQQENIQLRSQLIDSNQFDNIIGTSPIIKEVLRQTAQIAQSDATVLIQGESGTGKELIARAIHFNSPRKNKPFIAVNCPSIPSNLLESELFGHVKGAFTGAINDRIGKFEKADKGSIFLDEIGELPDELQSKLLRVLQEQIIEQLGAGIEKKIDIRIITATNRDLYKQIKNGKFREDLYYRIAVVPITLPSLRERKEDIPLLVTHFLDKFAPGKNIKFDLKVIDVLQSYDWPGNIRELENLIERVLVFLQNDRITLKDIPDFIFQTDKNEINTVFEVDGSLDGIQKEAIINALKKSDGNKSKAARNLNIPRHVLLYKIKKYNIR